VILSVFGYQREFKYWKLSIDCAACPICSQKVKIANVNKHLDSGCQWFDNAAEDKKWGQIFVKKGCEAKGKEKAVKSASLDNTRDRLDRLPVLSYDVLKDRDVKNLLKQQGLPIFGDSDLLRRRHKRLHIVKVSFDIMTYYY